uniref:Uncharacterized protein n=1 Tax=Panagrolaimus davidi TaxID=227884 RepID=A0A914PLR6_9BILA
MKTNIVASAYLSYSSKTKVKFHENIQFSVAPKFKKHDEFVFYIKDIKSNNFEITRIVNQGLDSHFDKANNCFENRHRNVGDTDWFTFYISADVEFKKVSSITYDLKIPAERMKYLEVYEYFEDLIVLPGHENLTFKYYVKKVSVDFVEVFVENGHNVKIEGKSK